MNKLIILRAILAIERQGAWLANMLQCNELRALSAEIAVRAARRLAEEK